MADLAIFDTHHHIGSFNIGGEKEESVAWDRKADYAQRGELMDKFGIRAAAVMPAPQYLRPNGAADTSAMNDLMAEYRNQNPQRFPIAMGTVEPLHGEQAGIEEIRRIGEKLRLDGVVWHHRFQGAFIADRIMDAFIRTLGDYSIPAFIHVFAESTMEAPWGLEALAERHPKVTFVALDAFSGATQSRYMMGIAKRCPNLIMETAAVFPLGRIIEEFVASLGSERLIFGTDLYLNPPMYHYPHVLHEILHAPTLSDQDKQNILWNNAQLFRF